MNLSLDEARTFEEIADVLARRCWGLRHGDTETGRNCPDDMIPTASDLVRLIKGLGVEVYITPKSDNGGHQDIVFASNELGRSCGMALHMMRHIGGGTGLGLIYQDSTSGAARYDAAMFCKHVEVSATTLEELVVRFHKRWMWLAPIIAESASDALAQWEADGTHRGSELIEGKLQTKTRSVEEPPSTEPLTHYAQQLVDIWQVSPRFAMPFEPAMIGSIPRINRIDSDGIEDLPTFDNHTTGRDDGQLDMLPPLGGYDKNAVSWLLRLFNEVGGKVMRKGKGAPYELRLFIGALLHLHVANRDGCIWHLDIPTDKVVEWLHPNGWSNRRRDWDRLPEALMAIRNRLNAVSIEGVGSVQLMTVSVIPQRSSDPLVRFTLMVPFQAAKGVPINWPLLCEYGTQNAPTYCAYLSASVAMDESARMGRPLTQFIGAPVLNQHGEPKRRRRGGTIIRHKDLFVPNPVAKMVRRYTTDDLTRMAGMKPMNRNHRRSAMDAFYKLHDDGVIDLKKDGNYWHIFGPRRVSS